MKIGMLIVFSLFSVTLNAAVTATVDRNTISEFDLLTLTIRVSGGEPDRAPDFSAISRDFDIYASYGWTVTGETGNSHDLTGFVFGTTWNFGGLTLGKAAKDPAAR